LYCYEQWLREDVRIAGTDMLDLHHLYRAMDVLEAHKEDIEQALYFRLADLLNLDVELIFYATTSLHFEIDEMDQGYGDDDLVEGSMAAGAKTYKAPRKRGLSKNGRGDAPQIVIGLAVTHDVLQRPGRFQQVAENLRVKEVVVGEGERRRRYVVCHNPQEEKRQRAHRQQLLHELEAELASLKHIRGESHSKRVCQLRASRRYGRYLRLTKGGLLRIDAAKRRVAEQMDGKFVVHSNDDSLTPADLALGYK